MMKITCGVWRRPTAATAAIAALIALVAAPAQAQDAPGATPATQDAAAKQDSVTTNFFQRTEVSGFVDTYYSYNFNTPRTPCTTVGGVAVFSCLRNFEVAHNSFSLNLAEVAIEKRPTADNRGGFRIDLNYGPAAVLVHGSEPGGTTVVQNIEQAYVSYLAPTGTGLQLDLGKFVTVMGNEVIETKDNWNYGRSLLFTLAIPYYHVGARLTYSPNDKVTLQGHVVNGWNNASDNNSGKSLGGSVTVKPTGALTIVENFMSGPEQNGNASHWRWVSDTIVTCVVSKQISLVANYDHGHDTVSGKAVMWHGVAGYLRYQPNDWFTLSPRVEWYRDRDGFTSGTPQTLKEATLTAEFRHMDGVVIRVEYRSDFSNAPFFAKNSSGIVKSQPTLTVGFIYAFTTKTQ